jgi:RNA polymerase subunit RPABC4/transcription elongation factor Spt4
MLTTCPDCHNQIANSAPRCPYCGAARTSPFAWVALGVGILVVVFLAVVTYLACVA